MVIRYIGECGNINSSLNAQFIPLPGDTVVIGGTEYTVESRKFDFDERVISVTIKRVRNEVEN